MKVLLGVTSRAAIFLLLDIKCSRGGIFYYEENLTAVSLPLLRYLCTLTVEKSAQDWKV